MMIQQLCLVCVCVCVCVKDSPNSLNNFLFFVKSASRTVFSEETQNASFMLYRDRRQDVAPEMEGN